MEQFRVTDDVVAQLARAYAVFGVQPVAAAAPAATVPTISNGLPDDWSYQIARAYMVFGTDLPDGVDEFGFFGKAKAAFRGARHGWGAGQRKWEENMVSRAPQGSEIGGQFIRKARGNLDIDDVNEKVKQAIDNARREQDRLRRIPPGTYAAAPANPGMPLPPKSDPIARARAYEEWAAAYDKFHEQMTGKKLPQRIHGQMDHNRGVQYASYMDGWMDMYRWWYEGNKHHWDKPEQERPTPEKPEEPAKPGPEEAPTPAPAPRPDKTEIVEDPPDEPEPADSEKWVQDVLPGMEDMTPEPATPEPATPEPATPEPATPEPATPEPATPEPATPEPAKPEPAKPEPSVKKREPNKAEFENEARLGGSRVEYDENGRGTLVDAEGKPFEEIDDYDEFKNVVRRVRDKDKNQIGWVVVEGPDLGKVKYTDRDRKPKTEEPPPVKPQPQPQRIDTTVEPGPQPVPKNPRMIVTPEGDRTVVDKDGKSVPIGQEELDWAEQAELIYDENGEPAGWIPQDGRQAGYYFPLNNDEKEKMKKMFQDEEVIEGIKDKLNEERKAGLRRKNKRAMEREAMKQIWQQFAEDIKEKGKKFREDVREKRRKEAFDKADREWKKNYKPDKHGNGDPPGKRRNIRIQRGEQDLDLELELDADGKPVPGSFAIARNNNGDIVGIADPNNNGEQYPFTSYTPGDLKGNNYRIVRGKNGEPLGAVIQSGPKKGKFVRWNDKMEADTKTSNPTNEPTPGIPPEPGTPKPNTPEPKHQPKLTDETKDAMKKTAEFVAQALITLTPQGKAAKIGQAAILQIIKSKNYQEWRDMLQKIEAPEAIKNLFAKNGDLTDEQWEIIAETIEKQKNKQPTAVGG